MPKPSKDKRIKTLVNCPACRGSGKGPPDSRGRPTACGTCGGSGSVWR